MNLRPRPLLVPLVVIGLSGCTAAGPGGAIRPDISFVADAAVLDPTSETVLLPLDAYGPGVSGHRLVERAADLLTEDCVSRKGLEVELANVLDYPPSTYYDLTFFGPWTTERAARTGLGIPYDALSEAHHAQDATIPTGTYEAMLECPDEDDEDALALEEPSQTDSVVERGRSNGWVWATSDPVWEEALAEYHGCMEDQGYTFDESRTPYSPTIAEAADSEAGIRAALDQVDCLGSTGAAQTFVDVVAAYQVAFIAENEAALVAEKKASEERVVLARRVIGEHGEG